MLNIALAEPSGDSRSSSPCRRLFFPDPPRQLPTYAWARESERREQTLNYSLVKVKLGQGLAVID